MSKYMDGIKEAVISSITNPKEHDKRVDLLRADLDIKEGEVGAHDTYLANTSSKATLLKFREIALSDEMVIKIINATTPNSQAREFASTEIRIRRTINALFDEVMGGES